MLAIKLRRVGKKHQVSYRMVVAEKRSKLQGRFAEDLGFYNPHTKEVKVDGERVKYWLAKGAKPTDTVFNLLVKNGLAEGSAKKSHSTHKRKKQLEREKAAAEAAAAPAVSEEAPAVPEAAVEETQAEEAAVAEEPQS